MKRLMQGVWRDLDGSLYSVRRHHSGSWWMAQVQHVHQLPQRYEPAPKAWLESVLECCERVADRRWRPTRTGGAAK